MKRLVRLPEKWKERLTGICEMLERNVCRNCWCIADQHELQAQLEFLTQYVKGLESQLDRAQRDRTRLDWERSDLCKQFAAVVKTPDERLRKESKFDVRETDDHTGWEVVTAYCSLGGCDMGVQHFSTQRDALLFGALLSAIGHRASGGTACPSCYREYMKDCL